MPTHWHPCHVVPGQEARVAATIRQTLPAELSPALLGLNALQRRELRETKKGPRVLAHSLFPGYILLQFPDHALAEFQVFLQRIPGVIALHEPLTSEEAERMLARTQGSTP